jgi:hypothetical protein
MSQLLTRSMTLSQPLFTRASYALLSGFVLTLFLLGYFWWPLAEEYLALVDWQDAWWQQLDYLLIGIFLVMTLLLMAKADIRADLPMILVGLGGGLVIESWGTQTELWSYYTLERPPLWIIPAWPIAGLSIERLTRLADWSLRRFGPQRWRPPSAVVWTFYTLTFAGFYLLMLAFVRPALDKPLTWLALALCALIILTPPSRRTALITFTMGASLGYFLELWGTTRLCWVYYTLETPPLFAILAHGMAAVAFWRATLMVRTAVAQTRTIRPLTKLTP